jgi:uncharacterized membrane protein YcjF (UPF0283 family)
MQAQAGMVTTGQLQSSVDLTNFGNIASQRDWIEAQLLRGGVAYPQASARVAAMTDVEVTEIYQRIDELPAGASTVEIIIIIGLVLVITELLGYTDLIPNWPDK